jgi:hypothetical protein
MYKVVRRNYTKHAAWAVVRQSDNILVCVCEYKRGAIRVMSELRAVASGQKQYTEEGDKKYEG